MAQFVLQLAPGKLVLWSNTVDAPVSPVLDASGLTEHLLEHEQITYEEAVAMISAAERDGTSDPSQIREAVLAGNRAGPNEEPLDILAMIARYS